MSSCAWHARADDAVATGPPWVLLVAIDGFAQLVARHGNQEADRLLAACADAWGRCLRDGDLLGRLGGPVFAATVDAHELGTVLRVAGRLRTESAHLAACSVAVVRPRAAETAAQVVDRGTLALEQARRGAGGRTAVLLDR